MENWKVINNYPKYEISNYGNLRKNKKIVKTFKHKTGYIVKKIRHNNISKTFYIHRLVAIYFIENIDKLSEVNHIDGNKANNNVFNLEWVTHNYNNKHAFDIGLKVVHSKLKDLQKIETKRKRKKVYHYDNNLNLLNIYNSVKEAGNKLNYFNNLSFYCRTNKLTKLGIFSYKELNNNKTTPDK